MSNFKLSLLLFFVVSLFFIFTAKGVMGNPTQQDIVDNLSSKGQIFESSQERARYALAESLVFDKSVFLDKYSRITLPDVSYANHHYISVFQPGVSAFIAPLIQLGKIFNISVILAFALPALLSVFSAIFIFLICRELKLSQLASFLAGFLYPLATIAWPYSITLYAHSFSAFFVIAGFYFALKSNEKSFLYSLMVWVLYGSAILVDYPNALIMFPVIILLLSEMISVRKLIDGIKKSRIISLKIYPLVTFPALLLILLLLGLYNYKTVGSWYEFSHNYRVTQLVTESLSYHFQLSNVFSLKNVENGIFTLLASPERGLFFYVPISIFAIFGFSNLFLRSKLPVYLVLSILINIFLYSAFYDPWGGWSYGPRYLISCLPLLAIIIGAAFDHHKKSNIFVISFYIFFLTSFAISLLGALTTNLLPPSVEVGREVIFLDNLKFLGMAKSSSLLFNWAQTHLNLGLAYLYQYYLVILALFTAILTPIFSYQIIKNIHLHFRSWRERKETETYA